MGCQNSQAVAAQNEAPVIMKPSTATDEPPKQKGAVAEEQPKRATTPVIVSKPVGQEGSATDSVDPDRVLTSTKAALPPIQPVNQEEKQRPRALPPMRQKQVFKAPPQEGDKRKVLEHCMAMRFDVDFMPCALDISDNAPEFFAQQAQFLVSSPSGAQVEISVSYAGLSEQEAKKLPKIQLYLFQGQEDFPLAAGEHYAVKELSHGEKIKETISSIHGFVCFVCGAERTHIAIDGLGKPILAVIHPEPLDQ